MELNKTDFFLARKLLRINSNIWFLRKCRKNGLIPNGLVAKNPLQNTLNCDKAKHLAVKQSRQWLNLTLNEEYVRKDKFHKCVFPFNVDVSTVLRRYESELMSTKLKKFDSLSFKIKRTDTFEHNEVNGFRNYSNIDVSDDLSKLLNHGPSLMVPNTGRKREVEMVELQADLDICIKRLSRNGVSRESINEFSGGMMNLSKQMKNVKPKIFPKFKKLINEIKCMRDQDVVIVPTDKSSRLIALTKEKYKEMHQEATINTGNFLRCKNVLPITRQAAFNKQLSSIANKYKDNQENIYKWLISCKCSEPSLNSTYVLPKDHKNGVLKGRPIVAATDGPSNVLARELSKHLHHLLSAVDAHLPDAIEFVKWIKKIDGSSVGGYGSLDVVNLYNSIPRNNYGDDKGLYIVMEDFLSAHSYLDNKLAQMHIPDIVELIKLSLENDFVLINGFTYRQSNGLSMGNAIAPVAAIIYMDYIERKVLKKLPEGILWKRFIDDVYLVWLQNVSPYLNACDASSNSIKFTLELPDNNGYLPFLDCEVILIEDKFHSKLYRKPIHSGCILPWKSTGPMSQKKSVVLGELHRAATRSTNEDFRRQSLSLILNRFRDNGYPSDFLNLCVQHFQSRTRKADISQERTKQPIYLRVPFVNEHFKRQMFRLLHRCGLKDWVRLAFSGGQSLGRKFHPPKEKVSCDGCDICKIGKTSNQCHIKGVIYRIKCNICNKSYIGETGRSISTRVKEHLFKKSYSAVQTHFQEEHHTTDCYNNVQWEILHAGLKYTNRRMTLESIYISKEPSLMNGCQGRFITC